MAKGSTPIAASALVGVALLKAMNDAGGSLMLTQAEGQDIIAAGHATVDTTKTEGDKALVTLTDAGRVALAGSQTSGETVTGAAATSSKFAIEDNVPMPTSTVRRGREGGYPFEKLEIGQSFHVAKTADNPDPATRLQSSVSGARVKFSNPTGEKETVTVKTYKRSPDGKSYEKDAEGKRIVETSREEVRDVLAPTRDFVVKAVGADDPRGEGARVWRIALDPAA